MQTKGVFICLFACFPHFKLESLDLTRLNNLWNYLCFLFLLLLFFNVSKWPDLSMACCLQCKITVERMEVNFCAGHKQKECTPWRAQRGKICKQNWDKITGQRKSSQKNAAQCMVYHNFNTQQKKTAVMS